MSGVELLGLLLTSSFLSAGLTSGISWLIGRANYKREYYKKLIDRRLFAFEKVESIVASLSSFVHRPDGTLCPFICGGGAERWDVFKLRLFDSQTNRLWLGRRFASVLTDLNVFVIDFGSVVSKEPFPDTALEEFGAINAHRFREFRYQLHNAIQDDLREMTDIKPFLKRREPEEAADFSPESIVRPRP